MKLSINSGDVIGEVFQLRERLVSQPMSELWRAIDVTLGAERLLRVYGSRSTFEGSALRAIGPEQGASSKTDGCLARIIETREADGLVLTVFDSAPGRVLSSVEGAEPMAYRDLVRLSRPIVEALLGIHEIGVEHGRVDEDHVIASDSGWVLLPPDVTVPSRPDAQMLGRFLAARLTSGHDTLDAGHLNDMPELLRSGRTIPAMFDGLIHDLRAVRVGSEPMLLRHVVDRFDQLERLTQREGVDGAAPVSEDRVPRFLIEADSPAPPRSPRRRWRAIAYVAPTIAALLLVAVIGVVRPGLSGSGGPESEESREVEVATTASPGSDTPPQPSEDDPSEADAALESLLEARAAADAIGASAWAGKAHAAAVEAAASADALYMERRFEEAAAGYREAETLWRGIVAVSEDSFERLLDSGREALSRADAQNAGEAFRGASLIKPQSEEARVGLARSATIVEVSARLRSGAGHERAGRLALALVEYSRASEIDRYATEASEGRARVLQAIADREYRDVLGRGLAAFHEGDPDRAIELLSEAERLRPGDEASRLLVMAGEESRTRRIAELDESARTHAQDERWQRARADYIRILEIDPTIASAQDGRQRSETMIRLEVFARDFISNPDLLLERETRDEGLELLEELRVVEGIGPRLLELRGQLAELVRSVKTPRSVVLNSDGATEIQIYHVGNYEPFRSLDLELLPGVYTIVGSRDGYRDVRVTLRVEPAGDPVTLTVVCSEPI